MGDKKGMSYVELDIGEEREYPYHPSTINA
jgi:hypothetical protein